jgi:hypothetical protein
MSNHFSAANLKFPEDDARLDLTDLFVFAAPDNRRKTVLILDTNPFMTATEFHPDVDAVDRALLEENGYVSDAGRAAALTLLPDILSNDLNRRRPSTPTVASRPMTSSRPEPPT